MPPQKNADLPISAGSGPARSLVSYRLDAHDARCEAVFAEVEDRRAGQPPSTTHESLLMAGFEQAFVRAEWRPPRHVVAERGLSEFWG